MSALLVVCGAGCTSEASEPTTGPAAPGAAVVPTEPLPKADAECVTLVSRGREERIGFVSPASGALRDGPSLDARLLASATSMGLVGTDLLVCAGTVVRVNVGTGAADATTIPCDALATDGRGAWVTSEGRLVHYADPGALLAGKGDAPLAAPRATVLAATADGLLASEPSTQALVHVSTVDGNTRPFALDGFQGAILGMAETASGRIAVLPWYTEGRLGVFDAKGNKVLFVPGVGTSELLHGLACPR